MVVSLNPIREDCEDRSITAIPTSHAGEVPVSTDWIIIIVISIQLSTRFPMFLSPSTRSSNTGSKSGRQYTNMPFPALHRSTVIAGTWMKK
jgi:hypothetical protein